MGLADLLQHKAGVKRRREDGGSGAAATKQQPAVAAAAAATNGHASSGVWRRSGLTRTARRNMHKAQRAAAAAAAAAAKERAAAAAAAAQNGAAEGGSSDDDVAAVVVPNGAAAGLAGAAAGQGGSGAYGALLGALQGASVAFADLYQQRRREQAGLSDEESSESESEGGSEGEVEAGEGAFSGDEQEGSLGGSDLEADGEKGGLDEGAAAADAANGLPAAAEEDGEEGGSEGSSSDEGEEEDTAEQGPAAAKAGGTKGAMRAAAAAPAGAAAAPEDHFSDQFDSVLAAAAAAALTGREGGGAAPKWEDRTAAAPWLARWEGAALEAAPGTRLPHQAPSDLGSYGVKERLQTRWREEGASASGNGGGGGAAGDFASPQQQALFALLNSYCDLLYPVRPYPTSPDGPDPELDAVLLHVLSHCATAADRVRKSNERLKAAAAAAAAAGGGGEAEEPPRDQGFVRPKVLLLLPFRSSAYRAVLRLLRLAIKETRRDSIQNKERFMEEFGPGDEPLSEREQRALARKPADYRALFEGNMDDHFRVGIKLTRGAVRLYTDFFQSDIIVASPLALATKLGEGPGEDGEHPQDFLSSIEVVVLERADVMLMQNWSHVVTVFEALNRMPHQQHGVDIMRVREWALSGWSRLYRQTILLSSFAAPEMNALLGRRCANHAGAARLRPAYPGVLSQVLPQVRQVFERLPAPAGGGGGGLAAEADARFDHFCKVAWPRMREAGRGGGQLIYVPSYFDFVRVRNFLKADGASFLVLSEYTDKADAARARSYFFDGRKQVLLFTERAQFYNRNRIRGIKDVLFYQLPEHAQFYAETLNLLEDGGSGAAGGSGAEHATVAVLFGRGDALRLERVVGSGRSGKMLRGGTTAFLFC